VIADEQIDEAVAATAEAIATTVSA
jgi:hypothetical protein